VGLLIQSLLILFLHQSVADDDKVEALEKAAEDLNQQTATLLKNSFIVNLFDKTLRVSYTLSKSRSARNKDEDQNNALAKTAEDLKQQTENLLENSLNKVNLFAQALQDSVKSKSSVEDKKDDDDDPSPSPDSSRSINIAKHMPVDIEKGRGTPLDGTPTSRSQNTNRSSPSKVVSKPTTKKKKSAQDISPSQQNNAYAVFAVPKFLSGGTEQI
jgi:hypothetical protein